MPIWGRRDSESLAEETRVSQATEPPNETAQAAQASGGVAEATGPHDGADQVTGAPGGAGQTAGAHDGPGQAAQESGGMGQTTGAHDVAGQGAGMPDGQQPGADEPAAQPVAGAPSPQPGAEEPAAASWQAREQPPPPLGGAGVPDNPPPAGVPVTMGATPAASGTGSHASGTASQEWREILAAFVDDPRGSVQMAADAVDQAIGEFVDSVRARQRDLASSWQGADAGTEQLRTALLEYRQLGQRVQQLDLGGGTGG